MALGLTLSVDVGWERLAELLGFGCTLCGVRQWIVICLEIRKLVLALPSTSQPFAESTSRERLKHSSEERSRGQADSLLLSWTVVADSVCL